MAQKPDKRKASRDTDVDPVRPDEAADDAADENGGPRPNEASEDLALVFDAQRSVLEATANEQRDKYLRLAAEFDNFRKRAARDREAAEHHGQTIVIRGLLDALDDLSRFAHLDPFKTEVDTVVEGANLIEQKLLKSLAGHGLEVVNPTGQPFDPAVHEAVSTAPAESAAQDHLVAQVYQVGYVFKGVLLRPARVVVKQWTG
jgi:molecular chaperone GrpE